jgi:IPT/TIG domain-containing protein
LITVYGINFTEPAKISMGNIEVTRLNVVDNAQINIMIPPGLPSGTTTTLTVRTDQGTASKEFRVL